MIGNLYRYPNSPQVFKLVEIRKCTYHFECGHWCTDLVFQDLIDCKTGIQNYKGLQYELF